MSKEKRSVELQEQGQAWSERFFTWCCSFFKTPNAYKYAYFTPLLLFFPSLFIGLVADDQLHYWRLHYYSEDVSFQDATFNLFEFYQSPNPLHFEFGTLPWWLSEETTVSFFRPITTWTHWLDAVLWKDIFFLHHLHSLVWAVMTVWMAHRVFVQLLGEGWKSTLCVWVFACQDSHTLPFAWLANRSMSISFFFSMLAFSLFLEAQRKKSGSWIALLGYVWALFVAESSVSVLGLFVAWACVYIPKKRDVLLTLSPYVGLTILWRLFHKSMGYGARGLHLYVDPVNEPMLFVEKTLLHFPILLLNLIAKVPAELYLLVGQKGQFWMAFLGFGCATIVLLLSRKVFEENSIARFWLISIGLMLLPVCATYPMERLLFFVGFSFSGLLLSLLNQHVGLLAKRLLVLHLPIAALFCIPKTLSLSALGSFLEMGYRSVPADVQEGQRLVFLNGPEFPPLYTIFLSLMDGKETSVSLLSASPDATLVVRGKRDIDIEMPNGWFAQMPVLKATASFAVGDRIRRPGFEAIVQEVNLEQQPTVVRFVMDEPIGEGRYRWMKWIGNGYEEVALPVQIGESLYVPDPWGIGR